MNWQIISRVLGLSLAILFGGFMFGSELILVYFYHFHDTGILFTGYIVADTLLAIAGFVAMIAFSADLYKLRRALQTLKKKDETD